MQHLNAFFEQQWLWAWIQEIRRDIREQEDLIFYGDPNAPQYDGLYDYISEKMKEYEEKGWVIDMRGVDLFEVTQ